jgi:Phospholipase_D-nuclease N-terminal
MATSKRWDDLTSAQQTAIVVLGAVEVVLTGRALLDLARRPAAKVRGRKAFWAAGCFVQPLGPVAYLAFGRRR